jgi:hypothetical protein
MSKIYVTLKTPINRAGGEALDELCINVDYQKGGINFFSGNYSDSGVFVYLTPVHRNGICVSQTILGQQHECGYKVLLKQINRRSQKQIDLMSENAAPYAQQIADLYSDYKHQDVYNLLKSIASV